MQRLNNLFCKQSKSTYDELCDPPPLYTESIFTLHNLVLHINYMFKTFTSSWWRKFLFKVLWKVPVAVRSLTCGAPERWLEHWEAQSVSTFRINPVVMRRGCVGGSSRLVEKPCLYRYLGTLRYSVSLCCLTCLCYTLTRPTCSILHSSTAMEPANCQLQSLELGAKTDFPYFTNLVTAMKY